MKIIYNTQTSILVTTNADYRQPGINEALAEGDFMEMDKGAEYYSYNGSFVVPRNEIEVQLEFASSAFNFELLVGELFQKLPFSRIKDLGVHTATMQWMATWKNWVGVLYFVNALLSDAAITQDEMDIIKGCYLTQGINLDAFAPPAP